MAANGRKSARRLGSDMARVRAHVIQPHEYAEAPELTDEMLSRAVIQKGGRPYSPDPRKAISIRLPASVLAKWRATGPGWQTRMADLISRRTPKAA